MSCKSLKNEFEKLKAGGGINFNDAVNLYNELTGSLDAHRMELNELKQSGDSTQITALQEHISSGEAMLSSMRNMTVQ